MVQKTDISTSLYSENRYVKMAMKFITDWFTLIEGEDNG